MSRLQKRLRGNMIAVFKYLMRCYVEEEVDLFFVTLESKTQTSMLKL